jgi:hypothetical protein
MCCDATMSLTLEDQKWWQQFATYSDSNSKCNKFGVAR